MNVAGAFLDTEIGNIRVSAISMSSPPSFKDFDAEACLGNYEAAVCGQLRSIATRSNPPSTPHNCPRAKLGLGNYAQSESLSPPFCNLEFKRNAASCCCFSMAIWAILVIVDDEISDRHNETLPSLSPILR